MGAAQVVHVEPGGIGAAGLLGGAAAVLQHGVVPRHRRVLQGHGAAGQPPHQEPAAVLQPHRAQHHASLQHLQPVPGAGGRAAAPRRLLVARRGRRGGDRAGGSRWAGARLAGPGGGGQRAARALEGGGLGGLGLHCLCRLRHLPGSVPKRSPPGPSAAALQCRGHGADPGVAPPPPSAAQGSARGELGRATAAGEAAVAAAAAAFLLRAGGARVAGEPLSVADRDAVPAGRPGEEQSAGVGGGGRVAGPGCGSAAGPGRDGGRAASESSAAPGISPRRGSRSARPWWAHTSPCYTQKRFPSHECVCFCLYPLRKRRDTICKLPEWQPDAVEDTALLGEALSDSVLGSRNLSWRRPSPCVCCCPKCFSLQQGPWCPQYLVAFFWVLSSTGDLCRNAALLGRDPGFFQPGQPQLL